jgi:hypothetical protein
MFPAILVIAALSLDVIRALKTVPSQTKAAAARTEFRPRLFSAGIIY